ncbi:hypothetical protein JCGZ_11971 [Jatropha curcas]|uniref:Uncharacterized protein n=1 Tax=Jatropha curcas TaxID=180498 RepID=A0A067KRY7_JATCU|nr:hypothetical protein JCGZ_11971 [Jatropha curcas]
MGTSEDEYQEEEEEEEEEADDDEDTQYFEPHKHFVWEEAITAMLKVAWEKSCAL